MEGVLNFDLANDEVRPNINGIGGCDGYIGAKGSGNVGNCAHCELGIIGKRGVEIIGNCAHCEICKGLHFFLPQPMNPCPQGFEYLIRGTRKKFKKDISQALRKGGAPATLASRIPTKFNLHLVINEYVHLIQSRRRAIASRNIDSIAVDNGRT